MGPSCDETIPVIVGVGQVNDRTDMLDPVDLMQAALVRADEDAGGGWLARLHTLAVVDQISFPALREIPETLATRLGATPRIAEKTGFPSGDQPLLLMHQAANRIGAGEITTAAVVGGEAMRTVTRQVANPAAGLSSTLGAARDAVAGDELPYRARHGLVTAADLYPLYENAMRASAGLTLQQGQEETATIWSLFSHVAAANPGAWIRRSLAPEEILAVTPENRLIAFPFTKLMVANPMVNQAAGFIVTSLAEAHRRGVPADRMVFVGAGAAARECGDVLSRERFDRSPSMTATLRKALEYNGLRTEELDWVELYSCFPCIPKMARRILGWPADRPASVTGGLTFAGGPVANYMGHAVVCMVERLRKEGDLGLLFANGGHATYNHASVLGRAPFAGVRFPQAFSVQEHADAGRAPAPALAENYTGPAAIETYTVVYRRDGAPRLGIVVARTEDGERTLANVPAADCDGIDFLTSGAQEPVGARGSIEFSGRERVWRRFRH